MGVIAGVNAVNDGLIFTIDAGNQFCYPKFSNGTVCGTANEGSNLILTAPAGAIFDQIIYASYGTPDGTCGLYTNGACHATGSTSIVATYLLNNSTGTIPATNAVFGDPCGGTYKRLYVEARYRYTNANDLTAKSNNAILVNGVGFTTTNSGSFSFDGTNDYMYLPAISALNGSSALTWIVWAKRLTSNSLVTVMQYDSTSSDISLELWSDGNIYFEIGNGSNSYGLVSNNSTSWQHVAMVYDGNGTGNDGRLKAYVNGVQQSLSYNGTIPSTAGTGASLLIGNTGPYSGPNSNLYSTGNLSSFQSYTKDLSGEDIKQNYNSTKRRYL
jgi:hypothetical protein